MDSVTKNRKLRSKSTVGEDSFSVVTYNILADCHIKPTWYTYTPAGCRTAPERHSRLMSELQELSGDIICLQEVGKDYHNDFLGPALEEMGYSGVFKVKEMGVVEGEATYYRKDTFKMVKEVALTFNEMLEAAVEAQGVRSDLSKAGARSHVSLILKLCHVTSGHVVIVGNIHTIWDNFRQLDMSTLHVALTIQRMEALADGGAVVVAGDFNSKPEMQPYQLASQGKLSETDMAALISLDNVAVEDKSLVELLRGSYRHNLSLASSYKTVAGEEPKFTNYDNYSGDDPSSDCLDYIWFGEDRLIPNNVLETIQVDLIEGAPDKKLPNGLFPSDHLSLKTTFSFKQ